MASNLKLIILVLTFLPFEFDVFSQDSETTSFWIIGNNVSDSTLSNSELQSIFLGDFENWKNGKRVKVVFHRSQTNEFEQTSNLILNSTANELKKYWLSIVFQGRANSPVFKDSCEDIIEYVERNEGTIAIIYNAIPPSDLLIKVRNNE